jgi:hypothetical protein
MKVYGAFWCSCIYESGMSLVSAHKTKKGAYKAIRSILLGAWNEHREDQMRGVIEYCIYGYEYYDKPVALEQTAWEIKEIKILD